MASSTLLAKIPASRQQARELSIRYVFTKLSA